VAGELAEVLIVPGRLGAVEDARGVWSAVPADAEPVAVGRLGPEPRMQTLGDKRVGALVERLFYEDGRTGVRKPAAHAPLLSVVVLYLFTCLSRPSGERTQPKPHDTPAGDAIAC
jgi:hypothetical protein